MIDHAAAFLRRQVNGGVTTQESPGKERRKRDKFGEIPLIAFLIVEESEVFVERMMGESLIFDEPNPFKVERFCGAAGGAS